MHTFLFCFFDAFLKFADVLAVRQCSQCLLGIEAHLTCKLSQHSLQTDVTCFGKVRSEQDLLHLVLLALLERVVQDDVWLLCGNDQAIQIEVDALDGG